MKRPKSSKSGPSGRFVLRLNPETHAALKVKATRAGGSLNDLCVDLILKGLNQSSGFELLSSQVKAFFGKSAIDVLLIGSHARGTATDKSDVDFLVVLEASTQINATLYRSWSQKTDLPEAFSVHFVHLPNTESPSSLWLETALEGQSLWSAPQVTGALKDIRSRIAFGLFRRKLSNGQPYWVRDQIEKDSA